MRRLRILLLAAATALAVPAAADEPVAPERQAETMAVAARDELGLTAAQTETLRKLLLERLERIGRQTHGVEDPAERSQIMKRIHRDFTRKLYDAYDRKTGNEIEGWYYNYTHKR